jgi:hypothetical protein
VTPVPANTRRRSTPMSDTTDFARPTAEHIAGLFRAHAVIPMRDRYLDLSGPRCGACAVGMLLVEARGGVDEAYEYREGWDGTFADAVVRATGWPADFVEGIDDGFTWCERCGDMAARRDVVTADLLRCGDIESPDLFREGFAIGWRAWELVKAGEAH